MRLTTFATLALSACGPAAPSVIQAPLPAPSTSASSPLPTPVLDPQAELARACDAGDATACARLGTQRLDAGDTQRGIPLLRKACEARDIGACARLGAVHEHGQGIPADPVEAERLYRLACDLGQGKVAACTDLASVLTRVGDARRAEAHAILDHACDADEPRACSYLGLIYTEGLGVPYNDASWRAGARLYQKSCDLGRLGSCWHLGLLYRAGHGVPQSAARARALFEKACDGGDDSGCDELRERPKSGPKAP